MECSVAWPEDHSQQLRTVSNQKNMGKIQYGSIPSSELDVGETAVPRNLAIITLIVAAGQKPIHASAELLT